MKKIFVISLFTVFALYTSAQETKSNTQKFHFGLKAAPSLAWLKTDSKTLSSDGSKFGFSYGLITESNFADHYAFATGIDVTYRGGKFAQTMTDTIGNITKKNSKINLEYVEIPLTLKFKTNEIGYFTYFLQVGVAPGIDRKS